MVFVRRHANIGFRGAKWVALLLLCLYVAAALHHLTPHDREHDDGEGCALCVLLQATAAVVCAVALVLLYEAHTLPPRPLHAPHCRRERWTRPLLRAPPQPLS